MSFISYAQNYEDVMLWRALKHIENGFYIDVGAAWPDEHSVTKAFYDRGWRGINIEPNPVHHASLVMQRTRDINLQLAIGECAGQLTMNLVGDTGLSTLDPSIADQHKDGGWGIVQQTVSVDTLASVCLQHLPSGQPVHFLKVDVEGFEEHALRSSNWTDFRPWIILVEATLPMTQQESYESWEPILLGADYLFAYADGLNRYYIAKEHENLASEFKYPPNFFDDFLLIGQQKAEAKAQQAEAKAQQAEAKAQQAEAKAQQAEAKAQQAAAKAQQAEGKEQQAEAKAQQAAAKAQQAEAKAQQAEGKAQQAEAKAQQAVATSHAHVSQLHAVYKSTSWRITAPLRWLVHQLSLLRAHGFKQRAKAAAKKIFRKIVIWIVAKPKFKTIAIKVANKLGLAVHLKPVVVTLLQPGSSPPKLLNNLGLERNHGGIYLDKRAARVFADLQNVVNGTYGQ